MRFLAFVVAFWAALGWAQSDYKVISDIDGTLRRTHVRATGLGVFNLIGQAFVGNNYFSGLPELMTVLAGEAASTCYDRNKMDPDVSYTVSYVTAAPGFLSPLGRRFLRKSCFPLGDFHHRKFLENSKEFKYETIVEILEASPSKEILLIGDNGQADPEVYDWVKLHFEGKEGRRVTTFIHMVYSAPVAQELYPGQKEFLTGADLAAQLFEQGWISQEEFEYIVGVVHRDLISQNPKDYEKVFPRWIDCSDFAASFSWPEIPLTPETRAQLEVIDRAILQRCLKSLAPESPALAQLGFTAQAGPASLQCAEVLL